MGNVKVIKNFKTVNGFWKRFEDFVDKHPNMIWRGQANEKWKLHSTWYRYLLENKKDFGLGKLDNFIMSFESYLARGNIFPFKEKKSPEEWLMYARHFGLPSPYIDFTYSPYIGLFFAFSKINERRKVLYCIDVEKFNESCKEMISRKILERFKEKLDNNTKDIKFYPFGDYNDVFNIVQEWLYTTSVLSHRNFYSFLLEKIERKKLNEKSNDNNLIKFVLLINKYFTKYESYDLFFVPYPDSSNKRMIRQLGCFIYDTLRYKKEGVDDLEEFIDKHFPKYDEPIMYKWLIPNEFRDKILKKLDLMNINGISLFGDESGAVLDTVLDKTPPTILNDSKIDFEDFNDIDDLFE